jgi:hypothetical protein
VRWTTGLGAGAVERACVRALVLADDGVASSEESVIDPELDPGSAAPDGTTSEDAPSPPKSAAVVEAGTCCANTTLNSAVSAREPNATARVTAETRRRPASRTYNRKRPEPDKTSLPTVRREYRRANR